MAPRVFPLGNCVGESVSYDGVVPCSRSFVLADGFNNWLRTFKGKRDSYIENFDQECWNTVRPVRPWTTESHALSPNATPVSSQVGPELVHVNDQFSPRDAVPSSQG